MLQRVSVVLNDGCRTIFNLCLRLVLSHTFWRRKPKHKVTVVSAENPWKCVVSLLKNTKTYSSTLIAATQLRLPTSCPSSEPAEKDPQVFFSCTALTTGGCVCLDRSRHRRFEAGPADGRLCVARCGSVDPGRRSEGDRRRTRNRVQRRYRHRSPRRGVTAREKD